MLLSLLPLEPLVQDAGLGNLKGSYFLNWWYSKSASVIISRAPSCVASRITGGAQPSSDASSHLLAHKHQRSPGSKPGKLNSGLGVIKSLPFSFEYVRNASLTSAHTVCCPESDRH